MRAIVKSVICVCMILMILFSAALFFIACDESDLPALVPAPQEELSDPIAENIDKSATTDPAKEEDSALTADLPSSKEEQGTQTEDPASQGEHSSPDDATKPEKQPSDSTPPREEQTSGDNAAPTDEGSASTNGSEESGSLGEENAAFDSALYFDLSRSYEGLYRYIHHDDGSICNLYFLTREIGRAALLSNGNILFSWDFEEKECEVWGTWEEDGTLRYFVLLRALEGFREIRIRPDLLSMQLNLTEDDLSLLAGEEEPHESDSRPCCSYCNALLAKNSLHASSCPKYTRLPIGSPADILLSEIEGMPENLIIDILDNEAEHYSLTFNYLDTSAYLSLIEMLEPYLVYDEVVGATHHLRARGKIDDIVYTFVFEITRSEEGLYQADLDVLGVLAEENDPEEPEKESDPTENSEKPEEQEQTEGTDPSDLLDPKQEADPPETQPSDPLEPESGPDPAEDSSVSSSCPQCGMLLSATSAHASNCPKYGEIPKESAAYSFLSELRGMTEDVSIEAMDKENEIFSFTLNYLDQDAYSLLLAKLSPIKTSEEISASQEDYRASALFGDKFFVIALHIEKGDVCFARWNLTGCVA